MKYELIAFSGWTIAYRDVFSNKGIAIARADDLSKRFNRVLVNRLSNGVTVYAVEHREV